MLINYWDCKFNDYDEIWDGEDEVRLYGCTHPKNGTHACDLENKFAGDKDNCDLAEIILITPWPEDTPHL